MWLTIKNKGAINLNHVRKLYIKDGTGYLFNGKSYNYIIRADEEIIGGYDTMEDAFFAIKKIVTQANDFKCN